MKLSHAFEHCEERMTLFSMSASIMPNYAALSTRSTNDAASTSPAQPIHTASAASHVLPIDASSNASPMRSIKTASTALPPARPIDPVVTVEKVENA